MKNSYQVEQLYSRVSLAVRLIDDYTSGPPVGNPAVEIKNRDFKVIKNLSGYYVFSDIPPGSYTLSVNSEHYLKEETEINTGDLEPDNPVVNISLKPGNAYLFPAGETLLRAVVQNPAGQAIQGASVLAETMLPGSAVKARTGSGGAAAGDMSIRLVSINGSLKVGDSLLIKDSNRSRNEFCLIASPLPANPSQPFRLRAPLKFNHNTGTPLYLMTSDSILNIRTGDSGEFVIYFKLIKSSKFLVKTEVSHPGCQACRQEVEVCEGSLISLGIIQLTVAGG